MPISSKRRSNAESQAPKSSTHNECLTESSSSSSYSDNDSLGEQSKELNSIPKNKLNLEKPRIHEDEDERQQRNPTTRPSIANKYRSDGRDSGYAMGYDRHAMEIIPTKYIASSALVIDDKLGELSDNRIDDIVDPYKVHFAQNQQQRQHQYHHQPAASAAKKPKKIYWNDETTGMKVGVGY